jgi:hypothetical protein
MSALPAAAAPLPAAAPDPADALMREALAAPTGPGAGYLPDEPDPLRDGLLAGHANAPRLRRLAAFQRDPGGHLVGWRLAAMIRAAGAEVALAPDGSIQPRGFNSVPPFLREEARRERDALAAWLAIEADTPAALRGDARPPFGAAEALAEGVDWCAACGPPPEGACATWWTGPGARDWRCATCCPPPDDDRVTCAYGRSGSDSAPAGCAPGAGAPDQRAEGTDT